MTPPARPTRAVSASRRSLRLGGAIIALGLALSVGLAAGWLLGAGSDRGASTPAEDSVDAGFARDMQSHHAQAVQMSMLALETSQDPAVRTLASDVLLTQQQQVGQMYAWLREWNLPQSSSRPPMEWMPEASMAGMDGMGQPSAPGGAMPGMASAADLARLGAAEGAEADRLYLQLMIPHHQGGIQMATAAARTASTEQVRRLAQTIVNSQSAELTVLTQMLDERGGPVS